MSTKVRAFCWIASIVCVLLASAARAESIWLEAEHLTGIKGYCWPMGTPAMKQTSGHWGLSGPGWAAEWNQGGESGFPSIATADDDNHASATTLLEIPVDGRYFVWVRYGDWREQPEPFEIRVEQPGGAAAWSGKYGEHAVIDEDNEAKLYWGWAFAWDARQATLRKGPAKLSLLSTQKASQPRQIDVIVLTTDAGYRPLIKDRPKHPSWQVLDEYRQKRPRDLVPLARRTLNTMATPNVDLPNQWRTRTFRDKDFLYLWNSAEAGSSMFYHEQGFDEFWQPGGTTAAGKHELQLSPKGKLVDRFLRTTAKATGFDRGSPYTPVAFLADYAHGWEPAPFWPNSFKNWHGQQDRFLFGDHERMLEEYFWSAFHPIGPESEKPMTGTNEVFLPGIFGDMFDVVIAYPDVNRWKTIDTYPIVIATGDIELTAAEGARLAKYVEQGGTLLVADTHLTGPGVAALKLPATTEVIEAESYRWLDDEAVLPSQRFRCRPVAAGQADWKPLVRTPEGQTFCAATDRGAGRLIYLSVPRGFGIDRRVIPVVPRLIAHLTRGQMPIEVDGDVQWLVNRNATGWMVTLLNPAGQDKPQQGITATDYRQNRKVVIRSRVPISSVVDRLLPTDRLSIFAETTGTFDIHCEVLAGGVRVIELK